MDEAFGILLKVLGTENSFEVIVSFTRIEGLRILYAFQNC